MRPTCLTWPADLRAVVALLDLRAAFVGLRWNARVVEIAMNVPERPSMMQVRAGDAARQVMTRVWQ